MTKQDFTEWSPEDIEAYNEAQADTWEKERKERIMRMSEEEAYEYKKSTEN